MKAFPLRACGMAVGAAVLLGGCSSLPLGDVPIVDRSVPTSGEHTTAGSQSSSFAPLGDVRDSGRTHTVTVGDTIYNISVRYGVTPSALMQLNAVTDPTQLAIGRVLHIPESTAAPREVTMPEGVRVNRIEHVAPIEAAAVSPAAGSSSSGDRLSADSDCSDVSGSRACGRTGPGSKSRRKAGRGSRSRHSHDLARARDSTLGFCEERQGARHWRCCGQRCGERRRRRGDLRGIRCQGIWSAGDRSPHADAGDRLRTQFEDRRSDG